MGFIPFGYVPARRHKCCKCGDVFECHLCTIGNDHLVHKLKGINDNLVCNFCCKNPKYRILIVDWRGCGYPSGVSRYDLLTGNILRRNNRNARKFAKKLSESAD